MKNFRNAVAIVLIAGMFAGTATLTYASAKEPHGLRNLVKRSLTALGKKDPTTRWENMSKNAIIVILGLGLLYQSVTVKNEELSTMIEKDVAKVQESSAKVQESIDKVQELTLEEEMQRIIEIMRVESGSEAFAKAYAKAILRRKAEKN